MTKTKLALAFLTGSAALVTSAHAKTFSANFDGFCDGISVELSGGVAYGTETGCVSGPAVGSYGKVKTQGKAITVALDHVPGYIYILQRDYGTWAIYAPDGSMLQSGTFTETSSAVVDAASRGHLPATGQ